LNFTKRLGSLEGNVELHPDLMDLLGALVASNVDFIVVGGWAVSFHSEPRFTKDLDLLIGRDDLNLTRVVSALQLFGAPTSILDQARTLGPEEFLFFGTPPARVDLLRAIPGLASLEEGLSRAAMADLDGFRVPILSLDDLIHTKRAAGRARDLRDLAALERIRMERETPK
jgi:predicted nucleotidyltransferase